MRSYGICLSLSGLLHLVWSSLGPTMLLQMALIPSFSQLSNIPLYICTTSSIQWLWKRQVTTEKMNFHSNSKQAWPITLGKEASLSFWGHGATGNSFKGGHSHPFPRLCLTTLSSKAAVVLKGGIERIRNQVGATGEQPEKLQRSGSPWTCPTQLEMGLPWQLSW